VAAALDYARSESGKKAAIIGYCLGGMWRGWRHAFDPRLRWATTRQIANFAGEKPKVPIMLHFGMEDHHIPKEDIDAKVHARILRFHLLV